MKTVAGTWPPLLAIRTYRLIPARVRRIWAFGSSTSHLALAAPSWGSIWHYGLRPALQMVTGQQRGGPSWLDPRDL